MKGKDALFDSQGFFERKTLLEAKLAFELYSLDQIAVIDGDRRPVGVLTRKRVGELIQSGLPLATPVSQLVDKAVVCIRGEEEAHLVIDNNLAVAFVVDDAGRAINFVTKQSLLRSYFQKLELTNTNLQAIIEAIDAALVAINPEGVIVYANAAAKELFAAPEDSASGVNLLEHLPLETHPYVTQAREKKVTFVTKLDEKRYFVRAVPIRGKTTTTGAIFVFEDVSAHELLKKELKNEKHYSAILKTVLEIAYDGIVVVDKHGLITMMSQDYLKFLGLKEENAIGHHVTDIIENTRMHIVVETGIPEIADIQLIKGSYMVATRIPMISNGEIIGAVGKVLFRNIDDLDALREKISRMEEQLELYKGQINKTHRSRYSFSNIIGRSESIGSVKRHATKAALSDATVLLLGESGVGKEVFAQAIHSHSKRSSYPFVRVNCAAIPNELLEMDLFGFEEGAFFGARKGGKMGKFEIADGGTLFLDEIADMPLSMQAKILRVLQEREVEKIGSETPKRIDVRIIVSSNKDLEERVRMGFLREDLYYRICAWSLVIPPLRDRKEDIIDLVEHILDKYSHKYGKPIEGVSEKTMSFLYKYSWPGNVRELENELERAIGQLDKDWLIQPEHLSEKITLGRYVERVNTLDEVLLAAERQAIIDSLRHCANNKSCAAKLLGIGRTSLYEKMIKHNLISSREKQE
ncbi:MAG: sigma-54 dependent transcription regulator [Bacillota bacterium]|nr:MAG: sigma-54 dependent transcription regulator [Bacillota bacterium]